MKKWFFGGLGLVLMLSGLAFAQDRMTITFKDGRTQSIDINTILKIEYQATQPASSINAQSQAQVLSGRWVGTFHNSLGDSGATTLNIVVKGNTITGTIDGDQVQNMQWDGKILRFSLYSNANKTTYIYEFQLVGDKRGKLTYQASSSTRNYSGYVNDYVRQ